MSDRHSPEFPRPAATVVGERWLDRILGRILAGPALVAIDAPHGYGVDTLVARLTQRPDTTVDLGGGATAQQSATSMLLVCSPPAARGDGLEATIESVTARGCRVVLIGPGSRTWTPNTPASVIDWTDLSLSEDEALELADTRDLAHEVALAIHVLTNGWPAYFDLAAGAAVAWDISRSAEAFSRLRLGPHLSTLLVSSLGGLNDEERHALGQLSHFERFGPATLDAVLGSQVQQRVIQSGFPLLEPVPGSFEIPDPVRAHLRNETVLDSSTATLLCPAVVADVGLVAGARLLMSAGHPAVAAQALRSVPVHELDEGSQAELLSVLRTVLDTEKDDGTLYLRMARVLHNRGELADQRLSLERASELASEQLNPAVKLEADAELLLLDLPWIDPDEAQARHSGLVDDADRFISPAARIRLREVAAMLSADCGDLGQIYRSVNLLETVARDWEVIGERARAAATLRLMTMNSLLHLGRYPHALATMERACDMSADHPQSLAKSVELLARVTALVGDVETFDEVAERAQRYLEGQELTWAEAYLAWSAMVAAGFRGDAELVRHHHHRAESLLGDLLAHETGVIFSAEAGIALAMAGAFDDAHEVLHELHPRRHESPLEYAIAAVTVTARAVSSGSGSLGELEQQVETLRDGLEIPRERAWRIDLEVELARRSRTESSDEKLESITQEACRHGLGPLADAIRSTTDLASREPAVHITLLGGFSATRDGQDVDLPTGRVSELVRLLAVSDKPLPVEVIVDRLWRDATAAIGTRRLKNIVNRARTHLGDDAIVRRDGTIALGPSVTTDLVVFRAHASSMKLGDADAIRHARAAVDLYGGPLLELDLYTDWIATERTHAQASAVAALTMLLGTDAVSPAWAYDAARRIDAEHVSLYLDIVELAARRGDTATALAGLSSVADVCASLGLELPADYFRLSSDVH